MVKPHQDDTIPEAGWKDGKFAPVPRLEDWWGSGEEADRTVRGMVVASLKAEGWEIVKFYTRADLDEDQELAENISLCPEDGLWVKERL